MRFVIFILLTFYPLISVYAQDASRIPVFLNNLQTATTDSARVEAYRDLCFNYSIANTDSGIYYGKKGLEIAQRIKFLKGIGDSYNSLGWCYSRKGDYTKAKKHLHNFREWEKICLSSLMLLAVFLKKQTALPAFQLLM